MFRILFAAAKFHTSGRRFQAVTSRLDAVHSEQAVLSMLAAGEFRADTRARKGEERDEQQQRHPGD